MGMAEAIIQNLFTSVTQSAWGTYTVGGSENSSNANSGLKIPCGFNPNFIVAYQYSTSVSTYNAYTMIAYEDTFKMLYASGSKTMLDGTFPGIIIVDGVTVLLDNDSSSGKGYKYGYVPNGSDWIYFAAII